MKKAKIQKMIDEYADCIQEAGGVEVMIFVGDKTGSVFVERVCPQFRLVMLGRMANAVAFDLCPKGL